MVFEQVAPSFLENFHMNRFYKYLIFFYYRCKFACGLCDLVTVDSRQMRLHIATHHSLSMDAYHQEYGTTEIVTRKFRCELPRCNSEMKFCRQNIYAHMKDVHKITLVDYEAQIGVKAKDIVPVEEMDNAGNMLDQNQGGQFTS